MVHKKIGSIEAAAFSVFSIFIIFIANIPTAYGAGSGCVTCHLDQEMLKKTVSAKKGAKSALQSGAG